MSRRGVRSSVGRSAVTSFTVAVVVAAMALLLTTACGPGGDGARVATRSVAHEFGSTAVPVEPRRVVALDEPAGLALLAVGVVPVVAFGSYDATIAREVLTGAGTRIVASAGPGDVAVEAALAQAPDLVVFSSLGDRAAFDRLAPAVATLPLPPTTESWRSTLSVVGTALGRDAVAHRLRVRLQSQIAALAGAPGNRGRTVSGLVDYGGQLALVAPASPAGLVLAEAGFVVPPPPGVFPPPGRPYVPLSLEQLEAADADVVTVYSERPYDAEAVTGLAGFRTLRGTPVPVNGEMWFASNPFATWWIVQDLTSIAGGPDGHIGTAADARTRWAGFRARTA